MAANGLLVVCCLCRCVFGSDLLQQLKPLCEQVISIMPTNHGCNNPACCNTLLLSALMLTHRKGSVGSGCRSAHSCSKQCKVQHWKADRGQRQVCKRLQKLEAAAAR